MQAIKHAVISAAGIGSRLELNKPKCLVDFGEKKLIDYILDLLRDVEDVRVVVGFMEEDVIKYIRNIRDDVLFVRNNNYINTTNAHSVFLGTKGLIEPYLIIDGDLIINPSSFKSFIKKCKNQTLIGITKKKTEEAVSVKIKSNKITEFINNKSNMEYEWSGIAYLKDIKINSNGGFVFKELEKHLPLQSFIIDCFEIDTPEDLKNATEYCKTFLSNIS
ncbi:NTP transferase domain-containing protein [Pelagibacterales bacterium]|nr:NTP transferase domain-containing protein [Pelagibacterales bacterium]